MKTVNFIIDNDRIVDYLISPVKHNIKSLFDRGYKIKFYNKINSKATSCDILILISKPVLNLLKKKSAIINQNDTTHFFLKSKRKYFKDNLAR